MHKNVFANYLLDEFNNTIFTINTQYAPSELDGVRNININVVC